MNVDTFLLVLALHWEWYILALFLSIAALVPVYKGFTLTWYDPLRYSVVFAMFANAVPLFLYFTQNMTTEHFCYFILSEGLFWLGIVSLGKKRATFSRHTIKYSDRIGFYVFIVIAALYFLFTLVTYATIGIPILMDSSRLSVYAGTGGLGILARFNTGFSIYTMFYSFYLLHKRKYRPLAYIVLACCIFFLIATASKFAFLNILFAYWGFKFFYLQELPRSGKTLIYLLVGIIAAVVVLLVQTAGLGGNLQTAVIGLAVRFAAFGDCYFYAYPDNVLSVVEVQNSWVQIFAGLLKPLRLIADEDVASIGNQLAWYVTPSSVGENLGPNARIPILSYIAFGWWGLLFSYLCGLFLAFMLFRLPLLLPKGIISAAFFTYLYITLNSSITDFSLGISYWFDFVLNFGFILGLMFLFSRQLTLNHTSEQPL